ncbi:unannotated protein [freshwater metagenome]|uniref:Unannotated protein n=1 Tax=freshwater metagenome TaxID=449393 RepID=A0A6J7KC35_9ZZZZ
MQRLADGLRERLVRRGLRCRGVDRAAERRVVQGGEEDADLVVDVDPRHILLPVAQPGPEAQAERPGHHGQRATLGGEHHAGPDEDDAHVVPLGAAGRGLPARREVAEEVVGRRVLLRDERVARVAVEAGRRAAHERPGTVLRGGDRGDELLRRLDPRGLDPPLRRRRPALEHRLAGQVDDRVAALDGGHERRVDGPGGRVAAGAPAHGLDVAERGLRLRGVAGQDGDPVAAGLQPCDEPRADQPGRSGDRDLHDVPPASGTTDPVEGTRARPVPGGRAFGTGVGARSGRSGGRPPVRGGLDRAPPGLRIGTRSGAARGWSRSARPGRPDRDQAGRASPGGPAPLRPAAAPIPAAARPRRLPPPVRCRRRPGPRRRPPRRRPGPRPGRRRTG